MQKAFQCSICAELEVCDTYDICWCGHVSCADPRYRDKADREACLANFKRLPPEKEWHEKFSWE